MAEFAGQAFDYVITVCDSARQDCPVFPGEGERLHWGYDDPSAAEGTDEERLQAFRRVFTAISQRIDLFLTVERGRGTDRRRPEAAEASTGARRASRVAATGDSRLPRRATLAHMRSDALR